MRNITVTFDDGTTHVYANAPDSITPEAVEARAQQDFGKKPVHIDGGKTPAAADPPAKYGMAQGALDAVNHGATLGWNDEALGFVQALADKYIGREDAPLGEIYKRNRDMYSGASQDFTGRHPDVAGLAQGTGAAVTALPLLATGAPEAQVAQGLLRRVANGAASGAAYGGVAGAGAAQPGQVGSGSVEGAAGGAVLGGAFSGLAEPTLRLAQYAKGAIGDAADSVLGLFGSKAAPTAGPVASSSQAGSPAAMAKILEAIQRDGMDPASLGARQAQSAQEGVPLTLADVGGPNLQGLARATVTLPGQGRSMARASIQNPLAVGQAKQPILSQVEDMAGMKAVNTDALAQQRRGAARQANATNYSPELMQQQINDPAMVEQLQGVPAYAKAHEAIRTAINDSSKDTYIAPLFGDDGKLVRAPTVQDVDLIKRGIDSRTYAANNKLAITDAAAKDKPVLKELGDARSQLLDIADTHAPQYAAARATAGDAMEIARATELGQGALNMSARDITEATARMSGAAKLEFKRAALDSVQQMLGDAADRSKHSNLVKQLFGTGDGSKRDQLAAIFGEGPAFSRFEQQMRNWNTRYETNAMLHSGSQTMNKAAEAADVGEQATDFAVHAATSGPTHAGVSWLAGKASDLADRHASAFREGVRNDIASNLFRPGSDTEKADAFMKALDKLREDRMARGGRLPFYTAAGAAGANQRTE